MGPRSLWEGRVFFVLARGDLETGVADGVEEVFSTMTIWESSRVVNRWGSEKGEKRL